MGILMSNLDELDELCTVCKESLGEPSGGTCYCTCSRCESCATIFAEEIADENIDWDTGLCTTCTD